MFFDIWCQLCSQKFQMENRWSLLLWMFCFKDLGWTRQKVHSNLLKVSCKSSIWLKLLNCSFYELVDKAGKIIEGGHQHHLLFHHIHLCSSSFWNVPLLPALLSTRCLAHVDSLLLKSHPPEFVTEWPWLRIGCQKTYMGIGKNRIMKTSLFAGQIISNLKSFFSHQLHDCSIIKVHHQLFNHCLSEMTLISFQVWNLTFEYGEQHIRSPSPHPWEVF